MRKRTLIVIVSGLGAAAGMGAWLQVRDKPGPLARASVLVDAASIAERLGGHRVYTQLLDFGKLDTSVPSFYVLEPTSPAQVATAVKMAFENGVPVRVRGRGHSMNGSSLPGEREVLLLTGGLRSYRFETSRTITVGAGVSVYAVNEFLGRYGYELPVMNDGAPGPSVGGYLSAGGMGAGAVDYGGFWENVRRISFIDGMGKIREVTPADEAFRWMFGSMGQLGVFVEITLDILPIKGFVKALPQPGQIAEAWESDEELRAQTESTYVRGRLYWFTLFVPSARVATAQKQLHALQEKYSTLFVYRPPYTYPFRFRTFNPPLVYHAQTDFTGVGLWGDTPNSEVPGPALGDLERDITKLAQANPSYRRYVQAETAMSPVDLEKHLGIAIYAEFRKLKDEFDPAHILNPGMLRD